MAATSMASWKREVRARAARSPLCRAFTCAGISRQKTTCTSLTAHQLHQPRLQRAEADSTHFQRQSELVGRPGCPRQECRIIALNQVDDAPVVAEVILAELRIAVEPEVLQHQVI